MSLKKPDNPYGDQELTEPRAMRALAHPVRLALLSRLQRFGPATATELSEHVDATPSVASWHLRHLAEFGLVRDSDPAAIEGADGRKRYWEASARGFRVELPDDESGRAASSVLGRTLMEVAADLPRRWAAEVEPGLPVPWRRESGLSNTGLRLSAAELADLNHAYEELLAPYVTRAEADVPSDARLVRVLHYVLPEGDPE